MYDLFGDGKQRSLQQRMDADWQETIDLSLNKKKTSYSDYMLMTDLFLFLAKYQKNIEIETTQAVIKFWHSMILKYYISYHLSFIVYPYDIINV